MDRIGKTPGIDPLHLEKHVERLRSKKLFACKSLGDKVLIDRPTDGNHPESPYNKLTCDYGQIMATTDLKGET